MRSFVRLGISILASYGAGFLATLFVSDGVRGWYAALDKPLFAPPEWLFGPLLFFLYGTMALALYLVWQRDPRASEMRGWVPLFFAHLILNAAWLAFFFGYRAILPAFIAILILFWAVVMLVIGARDIDRRAMWLLTPYAACVFLATVLNGAIWLMN